MKKTIKVFILIFLFLISFSAYYFVLQNIKKEIEISKKNTIETRKQQKKDLDMRKLQEIIDETTAKGVIVYDTSTNTILGSKNIKEKYSLASITKIITGVIVYEKEKALLAPIRDMMRTSNNQESNDLALIFGKDMEAQAMYMNNFTKKFGYFNFRNPSGLDVVVSTTTDERLPGGESDLISLINFLEYYYFKHPEIFDESILKQNNTNTIIDKLSFLNASKTGFTNLSGGNLFVSVQKGINRQIFIIVLSSTEKNRFVDVQNIANFLLQSSI